MRVFTDIKEISDFTASRELHLALGSFDGIHLGHQALLGRTLALAREQGGSPGVLLHDPHPAKIVGDGKDFKTLTSLEEKIRWIRLYGDINVFVLPFDTDFACRGPEEFAVRYLTGLFRVKTAVFGYNYRFGNKKSGDSRVLSKLGGDLGFACDVAPRIVDEGGTVSSTSIRRMIENGDIFKAYKSLGHCHVFAGEVVRGNRIGSGIGFPTANIRVDEDTVWPAYGVYGGFVMNDNGDVRKSVINIGVRPTVNNESGVPTFEAHLMEYSGDLYNRELKAILGSRLRPEERFGSLSELSARIAGDYKTARASLDKWEMSLLDKGLTPASLFTCFINDFPL